MSVMTTENPVVNNEENDVEFNILREHVFLLCPTVSMWVGSYKLPGSKVKMAYGAGSDREDINSEAFNPGTVQLLQKNWPVAHSPNGKPWREIFYSLRQQYHAVVSAHSLPFPDIHGARIVPKAVARQVFSALADIRRELNQAADVFCDHLPEIIEEIRSHLPPVVWPDISKKIPKTAQAMRGKFGAGMTPIALGGVDDQEITQADIMSFREDIRETVRQRVSAAVEEMIAAPRQELAAVIENLCSLLSAGGRITERSFNATRQALDKLQSFSFVATEDLLAQMRTIETAIETADPSVLRSSASARDQLVAAIRSTADEISSPSAITAAVQVHARSRVVRVD